MIKPNRYICSIDIYLIFLRIINCWLILICTEKLSIEDELEIVKITFRILL